MTDDLDAIKQLLGTYFDAWYDCDVDKLERVFHPSCHLLANLNGALDDDDMPTVRDRLGRMESGASRGDARHDRILMVDLASPTTAVAKVQLSIGEKLFTDYLSLLKVDHRWQIMNKLFAVDPLAERAPA